MGSLRTCVCPLLCLTLALQAPALCAQTLPDATRLFATCTGRLSALMEFQWLAQDAGAEATASRREAMAGLLAAALDPADATRAMALRIEAKAATAALLRAARFDADPERAARARRRSGQVLSACDTLMLS